MTRNETYLKNLKAELNNYTKKLSTIQKSFKGKTEKDVDNVYVSLKNILKEAGVAYSKLESASDAEWDVVKAKTSESFDNLKMAYDEALNSYADKFKHYEEMVEDYTEEKMELIEEYIKKHPVKSVLMAAGLGFVVARIIK